MQNIYIDFTRAIPVKDTKFHGGMNYTKRLLGLMSEMEYTGKQVYVLWPRYYEPNSFEELKIWESDVFKIIEVDKVDEKFNFEEADVLYFPLLNIRSWGIARLIKNRYPRIKIYLTIHGLRLLDIKIDKYYKFYNKKIKLVSYRVLRLFIRKILYKQIIKRSIPYFDKIFTCSNYSFQQIIKFSKPKNIKYYYQGVNISNNAINNKVREDFILFVSGNRFEKNLIRALEAFCIFKHNSDNDLFFFVTGVNKNNETNILSYFTKNDLDLIKKWVKVFNYVDPQFLHDLYKQCKFFLFTSFSEGFGLPVLEAMFYGKPVVASYATSIPEVGGSAVYYVDPFDVYSINQGIFYMNDTGNLAKHENLAHQRVLIMKELIKYDQEALINEILD